MLHSWCIQAEWDAPTIVGGEGARFWDTAGRSYLDMSSLAECMNLGHQHPRVVAAIRAQAERLCFVTSAWGAAPRAELADELLKRAGFAGGRVFFTLGGADANEHAVKFARQASGRPDGLVITRDRSYHGASYAAMALSGDSRTQRGIDAAAFRVRHVPPPYAYRCPFNSSSDAECGELAAAHIAEAIDQEGHGKVAAVLMEPNAGTNGIVAPDTFWPALREVTRARGVYLIADEVMSGFGRCGEWFAWQRYGAEGRPDLMTLAKGLTGGHMPLAAVVLSAEVSAHARARDALHRAYLLRPPPVLRRRRRRGARLRGGGPDRALPRHGRAAVRAPEGTAEEARGDRRRARRPRAVRRAGAGHRPRHAAPRWRPGRRSMPRSRHWCSAPARRASPSPRAAT